MAVGRAGQRPAPISPIPIRQLLDPHHPYPIRSVYLPVFQDSLNHFQTIEFFARLDA